MKQCVVILTFLVVALGLQPVWAQVGNISSIAGDGTGAGFGGAFGGDGGAATSAKLNFPRRVALDAAGNLYIADGSNQVIRRVDAVTGIITTVAGTPGTASSTGDGGPATSATLNNPHGIAVDASGNIYISSIHDGSVRKVDVATGNISTVATGFYRGIFAAPNGDIYLAFFTRIDKIDAGTGTVTTVAGNGTQGTTGDGGPATSAQINFATDVALDSAGNIYFVELSGHRVRKVDAVTGIINTIAGTANTNGSTGDGGQASAALLSSPFGITIDGANNIFISQTGENFIHIRKIDGTTGIITTVAGTGASSGSSGVDGDGGPALQATFNDPAGMVVTSAGDLLIADQVNHKVRQIFGIAVPPGGNPAPPDTVQICIGMALAAPGDTVRIPVLIENASGPAVGGLQMAVPLQDITKATFIGIEDTSDHANFDVLVNEFVPGTVNFTLFSINNATIAPNANPVRIATLVYVVAQNAPLGSTNELGIQGLLVGDEQGNATPSKICVGAINVGIKGDIDGDGKVTILDVIKLARILVSTDPEPAAGTTAFKVADADDSGSLDVNDITTMINLILNNPIPPTKSVSGPVAVTMDDVRLLADGQSVIPLRLDGQSLVAGMQATFTFDPSTLSVGTIQLGGVSDGLQVVSHVEDGVMRVVVFRYSPEAFLTTGSEPLLLIPVTAIGSGTPALTLSAVQLSTPSAQMTPVVLGNTTVVASAKSGGPSSFSLAGNVPNPFNPSTTISYEVPVQAHVQLVVYNLLGQEVVRLVNQVQAAGRYQVIWDARNALGQAVSSGVYVYRLTSDSGHSESKRMTLLK